MGAARLSRARCRALARPYNNVGVRVKALSQRYVRDLFLGDSPEDLRRNGVPRHHRLMKARPRLAPALFRGGDENCKFAPGLARLQGFPKEVRHPARAYVDAKLPHSRNKPAQMTILGDGKRRPGAPELLRRVGKRPGRPVKRLARLELREGRGAEAVADALGRVAARARSAAVAARPSATPWCAPGSIRPARTATPPGPGTRPCCAVRSTGTGPCRSAFATPAGPIRVPTMFAWGNRDRFVSRAAAELCGHYVAGPYRFTELDGASHWLPEQAADQVAALLADASRPCPDSWVGRELRPEVPETAGVITCRYYRSRRRSAA